MLHDVRNTSLGLPAQRNSRARRFQVSIEKICGSIRKRRLIQHLEHPVANAERLPAIRRLRSSIGPRATLKNALPKRSRHKRLLAPNIGAATDSSCGHDGSTAASTPLHFCGSPSENAERPLRQPRLEAHTSTCCRFARSRSARNNESRSENRPRPTPNPLSAAVMFSDCLFSEICRNQAAA